MRSLQKWITTNQSVRLNNFSSIKNFNPKSKITLFQNSCMKKSIAILSMFSLLAISCGEKSKQDKLKAKLAEYETLKKEITQLRNEIAASDTTKTETGKAVRITTLAISTFNHSIDIQGRVDADESVFVSPQMPGLVKRVYVQSGDKVKTGQVLAELDADAMTQQLSALKIQRDLAKDVYDRQDNLWKQKIGTEMQYLQAKSTYESADKQVNAMTQQIDMAKLRAPMDGIVDAVNIKAGEMAAAGLSSIVIVNTNKLRVKGEVAEGYVSKVQTGNPVTIYFPDADKSVETKISYSGRIINKVNRTFNVEVVLSPNETEVVPNMIAVLKINDYKNDSAIVIPLSSIQQSSSGNIFVYIAVKNKDGKMAAEKREVTYTNTYNGNAEILSGLTSGDQLITDGSAELNAGDLISIK
jgi:RND family efflux transporter MFP subunit